jgi:hypothetical protein
MFSFQELLHLIDHKKEKEKKVSLLIEGKEVIM